MCGFAHWLTPCLLYSSKMTPGPGIPQRTSLQIRFQPRWRRLSRVWQRQLCRKGPRIALFASVPLAIIMLVTGVAYHHYAKLIDAEIEAGPFRDSVNIYGAPAAFNDGDALSEKDIEAELTLTGYAPAENGRPGSFHESSQGLEIVPAAGFGDSLVRIVMDGDRGISRIEGNGRDIKTWTGGYPLLENVSPGRERRRMVTFQELPPVLVNAVVSTEDKHFFHHQGLDLARVAKAAYVDVRQGRKEQGASTLTMQLVRGLWLRPQKKWKRKIAEALMTVHLERKWSKEEIFAAYANLVFLGREQSYSIHGFAEASERFFGKQPRELNLPEAALLAGMIQRPSYFNPYRNPGRARERRDRVLDLMRDNGYIREDQCRAAIDTPLNVVVSSGHADPLGAPYFLDLVSDEVQSSGQSEESAKSVYTTIDLNLQRAAHEALDAGMAQVDRLLAKRYSEGGPKAEAALIALDPHTGEIKAMVGGRDYARSQLNRLFAKRPPGSVFKPFVYAAAINTGIEGGETVITPATTVDDTPATFSFGSQAYHPGNFRDEVFGTMTLLEALAKSDNVAAVKTAQMVGYRRVVAMARSAGLNRHIAATPAVALGSYAVTPFEMAGAYTAFANGGMWAKPQVVSQIQNAEGQTRRGQKDETRQAMDPRVAYVITTMLEEVIRSGTAAGVRARGFTLPAAGKTGTSHDGWFAGFTSNLLCIVWVGFDDYRELNLEGAKSALPIWTEFMKKAARLSPYRNAREFPRPDGLESARICLDTGKLAGDFCSRTADQVFIAGTAPQEKCDMHFGGVEPFPDDPGQTLGESFAP
jgi:penicillin-binding protein 1B